MSASAGVHLAEAERGDDESERGIAEHALALVALVHEGVFDAKPWQRLLWALRREAGAGYANIIFRPPGSHEDGLTEWADTDDDPQALRDHYFAAFAGRDPFPYFQMEPGRIMRMPELMGHVDYRRDPYFTGFLRPQGLEHMLLFRVVEPGGHQAWITVTRPLDGAEFSRRAELLCAAIAPHFAIALRAYCALEAGRITRSVRDRTLRSANLACVAIDGRRIVVHGDVTRLVGSAVRSIYRDAAGRLRLAASDADRQLREFLVSIEGDAAISSLALRIGPHESDQILVAPLTGEICRTHGAIANVYFRVKPEDQVESPAFRDALRAIYQLSTTEAMLAEHLVRGCTLMAAGQAVGLTETSTRTYSKRIFAKTGTTRQAGLITELLRSIAMLA